MKDSIGEVFTSCFEGLEVRDIPKKSWDNVKAGVERVPWPDWSTVKDYLKPDWNTVKGLSSRKFDVPRPKIPKLSINGLRDNVSDLCSSLHERVTSLSSECHILGLNKNVRGTSTPNWCRSAEDLRFGEKKQRKNRTGRMKRQDWYSSCFCFKSSEPPQIEHVISEQPQMVQMSPPPNMADQLAPEELQTKVTELLDELDLTASQKSGILNFPPEKQLQLLYDFHTLQTSNKKIERPEASIAKLYEYAMLTVPADDYQMQSWMKYTEGLRTALATQSNTFVNEFIDAGGLAAILQFLDKMDISTFQSTIHTNVIASVKALMNNSNGRKHILAHPECLNIIARSLRTENLKTKIMVLEILGGVCLLPGGHMKVLEAMLHFQKYAGERTRFQTLIVDMDRTWNPYADDLSLKIALMSFINAIIRWGPGEDSLEFRLHLRYEFLMLGIQPVIERMRTLQNDILDKHLDAFEYYRAEDEREWARRFEEVHVDTKSASSMFKLLQGKLQYSAGYPHFLSVLHHFLLLPNDFSSPDVWILFDRILQQLVTQGEDGIDREVKLININVNSIVKLIANERELTESRRKIQKLEEDFADVVTDLNNKEQAVFSLQKEKEDLERTLQELRAQLEAEVRVASEAQHSTALLEDRIYALTDQMRQLAAGSLSDDIKATIATAKASPERKSTFAPPPPPPPGAVPPPPPMFNGVSPTDARGCPPPPPPFMNGRCPGGPPPPPSAPKICKPQKQIPKSANQLRAFNWSKMVDSRVNATIFASVDESSLYKLLDLEDIDRTFDASSVKKTAAEGEKTLERIKTIRVNQISVLETRRQQNCTILLSKLKLTNEELMRVLVKMDSDGVLAPDMVEQLLKFTPTHEEKAMLEEHVEELDNLARADRFLYEISKIDHYEERLRCLLYQKKFKERLGECEPKIKAVLSASKELQSSKRLKKFMEVVLAFGNYMNKGTRGSAYGFRISSLNKLTDTKASVNRNITLLHYIIKVCEKQWKDILKLTDEVPSAKEASKVNIGELEKEIGSLRQGLDYIEKEVNWHRSQSTTPPGDRFRLAMNEFSALSREKFSSLETRFNEMKTQFALVATLFGEDSTTQEPEDFYGVFDTFFDAFREARRDLENMRKKEEEEEKKRKAAERREAERERRVQEKANRLKSGADALLANGHCHGSGEGGSGSENEKEFDDLISALRSGDVFGKDMDKIRRKKKPSFSSADRGFLGPSLS